MRSLKISGLLVIMLAALAGCSNTFGAAPSVQSAQPTAAQAHLSLDYNRSHGW